MRHGLKSAGAAVLFLLAACAAADQYGMSINGKRLLVELAVTPDQRQRGLMFRNRLAADTGMLFVFRSSRTRSFWMKNTRIPLSIAYLDASLRVVSLHHLHPYNEEPVTSGGPARYALEVNRGWFKKAGVMRGSRFVPDKALRKYLGGVRQ